MERRSDQVSDNANGAAIGAAGQAADSHTAETSLPGGIFDLTCPACDADLMSDPMFSTFRVCGSCHRHFSLTARERIQLAVDPDSFHELGNEVDARTFDGLLPVADRLSAHHDLQVIGDAIVTGVSRIGGVEAVVVSLDDHLIGLSLGALMAEKILAAFAHGRSRRCPVIVICAGGSARTQVGPLAVVQTGRLAAASAQLHMDGVPMIAILTQPTSGWIFRALASQCDLILAEPGARIGMEGSSRDGLPGTTFRTSEGLLGDGWIDDVVDRTALQGKLSGILDLLVHRGVARAGSRLPVSGGTGPVSWHAMAQLRNPDRPDGAYYLASLMSAFVPLHGDRVTGDDPGTVCGIARFETVTIAVAVLNHSDSPVLERSEAISARKIMRLTKLAGRLELPLVLLVDGERAPDRMRSSIESGHAVASLSGMLAMLPVPVIAVAVGEVRGALAQSLMSVDRQFMQENAVLTPDSRGSSGSIRFGSSVRGASDLADRGSILTAREASRLGLIDAVISEPGNGAHSDPGAAAASVGAVVQHSLADLSGTGQRRLLDTRHRRQRMLGQSTPEGLAAARSELWDLQEWQHALTKSIDDWRERWEQRRGIPPRLPLHRPDLSELADRFRARKAGILERAGHHDRTSQ